ncbi:MAG: response regulator, partial [Defluviitaleaceae bacterium]|nr:response regulator [Defluviitaleaceae bacterium]
AIEKTDAGRTYDIIFMVYMIPQMDGIEATQNVRQKGYKGSIVALTANALAGNDELYARNGFDGFISKPIDIEQLNEVMNANIRDRSGERASRPQGPDGGGFFDEEGIFDDASAAKNNVPDPELLKNFCREANKAVKTFRDISGTGNIAKLAAISHAMNAALSSIGEPGAAEFAKNLELAGLRGDLDYIDANAENFIVLLENLVLDYGENDAPIWSINEPTQKNGAGE